MYGFLLSSNVAAVVNTNEEWMIARDTAELAGLTGSAGTIATREKATANTNAQER